MADLFTDFKGIQVTTAVMARALIKGTIDCKTAGQMVMQLQTFSKLLWQIHRKTKSTTEARRHGEKQGSRQICADECRLGKLKTRKDLPLIHTDDTDLKKLPKAKSLPRIHTDDADWTELLWKIHRKERKENHISPQICADEHRLSKPKTRKDLPLIHTDNTDLKKLPRAKSLPRIHADGADWTELLWKIHRKERKGRKENHFSPQICADERRLGKPKAREDLPLIPTDNTDLKKLPKAKCLKPKETMPLLMAVPKNLYRERAANCDGAKVLPFEASAFRDRSWAHGPPKSKTA
jgi:hypothetical protein